MQPQGNYIDVCSRLLRHELLALITTVIVLIICSSSSRALQFEHPTFEHPEDVADVTVVTQDWYTDGPDAAHADSALWLTPVHGVNASQYPTNLGRIVYKDPILFFANNTNNVLSFNTSFSFQIITTAPDGECGSGMAFFISETKQAPNNSNNEGSFGLRNPYNPTPAEASNRFFAVEFDTRLHSQNIDPSYSHIGIDINSVVSSNTTDTTKGNPFYPDLYLYRNFTFISWIEYSAPNNLIQVWMTNVNTSTSHERPAYPCLQLHYDLSTLFLQRYVYVGFSATTAPRSRGLEGHAIYSWNFSNEQPFTSSSNISSNTKLRAVALGAGLGGGLLALMAVCAGVYMGIVIRRRRRNSAYRPSTDNNNIHDALRVVPRYSYRELKRATQGFGEKNKVGEGGFSSVYRGTLADGSVVAVKKLKQSLRMEAEFCTELGIISRIRHRYLLELQGWCYENREAFLVYKFMANGSLDVFLFGKKKGNLGRDTRFRILEGVAAALEYLHGGLGDCVLHRDVKAANVLLTEEFEPKLSDFGLARLIRHDVDEMVSMTVAGTPGYVAPELVYRGRATEKADVYSFGVLALEVACGRRVSMQERSVNLVEWVWRLHDAADASNMKGLTDALDPSILEDYMGRNEGEQAQVVQQWRCVVHVALLCCHPSPDSRPSMRQVTQTLEERVVLPLPPTRPAYPFTGATTQFPPDPGRSALVDSFLRSGGSTSSAATSPAKLQVTTSSNISSSTTSATTTCTTLPTSSMRSADSEPLSPR